VEHCPTEEMLSDSFTKPLQGMAFKKFRDEILNVNPDDYKSQDSRSVLGIAPNVDENSTTSTSVETLMCNVGNLQRAGILRNGKYCLRGNTTPICMYGSECTKGESGILIPVKQTRWSRKVGVKYM
jgi:hypothetical protein